MELWKVQASVHVCLWIPAERRFAGECMVKWLVNGKLCKRSYPNRALTQRRQTGETALESVKV